MVLSATAHPDSPAGVELHTPVTNPNEPFTRCRYGHNADTVLRELQGRCRVAWVLVGGQLWFGSEPAGTGGWLQVGPPQNPHAGRERLVSGVCGQIWVSGESGGHRVLVENLSSSVTIEVLTAHRPGMTVLHPADPARDRLGTAITALRAASSTLLLRNQGHDFPVWAELWTDRWHRIPSARTPVPAAAPFKTVNPARRDDGTSASELDAAALRIAIGSAPGLPVLRRFVADEAVRHRLEESPSLRVFLERNPSLGRTPAEFVERQLERATAEQPTVELHRLILEGLGTPPAFSSRHYTDLVVRTLNPTLPSASLPGGPSRAKGLAEQVWSLWGFGIADLERHLGLPAS